jgi:carbon-monoxide dehydrogenase medium subunit
MTNSRIRQARGGVGGAEPVPRRIPQAELILEGAEPNAENFAHAAKAAAEAIVPLEDVQVSAELRRHLVCAVVRRALQDTLA